MGAAAWVLLGLAAALAVADWVAVTTGKKRLEYVCKPATMLALIGVALALEPAVPAQRPWWLAALVLGLAGDIFLMLPKDMFVAGLGAFLLGHLAYIAGFHVAGVGVILALVYLVFLVLPLSLALPPVIHGVLVARQRKLVAPILVYSTVIAAMVASALAGHSRPAAAGAVLFIVSDGLIAYRRYVTNQRWMGPAIIVTYHLGQAGLVLSLAR